MKKLKRGLATIIKRRTGYSHPYISDILNGKIKLDTWSTAKRFAKATSTMPILWLEGSQEDIVTQVEKNISTP